ncbi:MULTISPECIES: ABC transporter substrate-binding protein [Bradyrhizobium]|jgi:branched-chain amino acid transport system substrate-binding protein|uniref:ABC transporter substrate-binding protein n=1 Tax=Bradyrhizobium TaxID=374 RepID=UPI000483B96D|nr:MULTISPECIES: ABC transporter substrate-binding protein [Bradyrhizobium]MDI2059965.1 ABC transporter substrate-binding protein [Bradyrhizobium sp. Mp19]MDI2110413.1 ABC transporter substrate-binding protein [Bradyrhizobium sp. Mp64]WLA98294.1 ABC transporter substrate-binding protein [Bradyrhizobium elkanii]WLC12145.1 ABC transporter substrate-binding protein [Bradyrhizobium elkanii USDA 94]
MPRKDILSAAVLAASIIATGCAAAQGTVKIGMVMPMTGPLAAAGQQVLAGARLYMKRHGDFVAGKRIEMIVRDDGSSGEMGKRLIQELIVNDKIDVIGGGLTADLIPSAGLITEAQKPTVIMLSSTTTVVEKSPFFVRTSCTLAQSSAILADWTMKKKLAKAVTLVTEFAPGLEAEETFTNNYKAAGGQIAEAIRVPLRNPDFAPFLQRVKEAAPQVLFVFVPSTQAATFARQFVERGLDKAGITLIGPGDLADDEALPNMGDAMLGTVTAHFYSAAHPSALNAAFVDAYREEAKDGANFMAVSGYDGMHAIYEALDKTSGSTDGKALVAAMRGMTWESPRGPMSIDRNTGEVVHNIYIRKVEKTGGELHNVEFETFNNVRDPRVAAR